MTDPTTVTLTGTLPRALAFYLPQFHPITENDEWWGKGFTEWRNVTRATPRFPGHYQPHLPGELGYYDLRVPEVRSAQAELARAHGISGFVYYHYWFHGKRLLERPFDEVLASGEPDFPFALCWSNEPWTREWDQTGAVLMPQRFSPEDDLAHIRWLATAFADPRYVTIDGRPLFLVYRPALLPDPVRTTDTWRAEAQRLGFPDLYLCWVESWGWPPGGPAAFGLDASVGFMPLDGARVATSSEGLRGHRVFDYRSAYEVDLGRTPPAWKRFPSVMASWDNTARRQRGARLYAGASPDEYERWLRRAVASVEHVREEENLLFLLAWNEWAEGNHLEPDRRYGRAYLEATAAVLLEATGNGAPPQARSLMAAVDPVPAADRSDDVGHPGRVGVAAAAMALATDLIGTRGQLVIDLHPIDQAVGSHLRAAGFDYAVLALHGDGETKADGVGPRWTMPHRSLEVTSHLGEELTRLAQHRNDIGALLLFDEIHRLARPELVLEVLARWSLAHGCPPLVVAVPNAQHASRGARALTGPPTQGSTNGERASFTARTLERLVVSSGWRVTASSDIRRPFAASHLERPSGVACEALTGAVEMLGDLLNPDADVVWFVRALEPVASRVRPAEQPPAAQATVVLSPAQLAQINGFVAATGRMVDERNRRNSRASQLAPGAAATLPTVSSLPAGTP